MKLFTLTLAFLWLGTALPASDAVGQQKTLKDQIVGSWILDSEYDQAENGRKNQLWGPHVEGTVMFDGNGRFSFQIISGDCSKFASENPRFPVGQALAYFGTYTVDEAANTVTYHIERATFPQWDGTDRTDNIAILTESELNITGRTPMQDPSFGPNISHLKFKR